MIRDARGLPDGEELEADLVIVGGGPAGLTIARALARSGPPVLLVESGGHGSDNGAQRLTAIEESSSDLHPHGETRWRQLGGTAHIWSRSADRWARYLPLTPLDLERRDWVPDSGWPFGWAELEPYLSGALEVCGVRAPSYRLEDWESAEAPRLPLDPSRFETAIETFGAPEVFTERYPAELDQESGVTVLTNATAAALEQREGSEAVERVRLAVLGGGRRAVRGRRFVLAAGAIENARLLLLSNAREPAGIGNRHGLVGRYLMEHAKVHAGILRARDPALMGRTALYDVRDVGGGMIGAKLALAGSAQREFGLLAGAARLVRAGGIRWSRVPAGEPAFDIELQTELVPDPANRLTLSGNARDELGMPRAALRWRWSERELSSIARTELLLAAELTRAGAGDVELPPAGALPELTSPSSHQMGTTRMHDDPSRGVVDGSGRVHGVPNLWVSGASTFPTGGYANPTLSIVALALRLADELGRRERPGGGAVAPGGEDGPPAPCERRGEADHDDAR